MKKQPIKEQFKLSASYAYLVRALFNDIAFDVVKNEASRYIYESARHLEKQANELVKYRERGRKKVLQEAANELFSMARMTKVIR